MDVVLPPASFNIVLVVVFNKSSLHAFIPLVVGKCFTAVTGPCILSYVVALLSTACISAVVEYACVVPGDLTPLNKSLSYINTA